MNHSCTQCAHPATTHRPVCDAQIDTIFGPEECGCSTYERDTDE